MSRTYSPSEFSSSPPDQTQQAASSSATFMADDHALDVGSSSQASGPAPLPSSLPDDFNDKLSSMRVPLPQGETGRPKDHTRLGVFQRRVFESYRVPIQAERSGRRFIFEVPFHAVVAQDWSQATLLKQVGGGDSDHDNPFGRFADVPTVIVLDDEVFGEESCGELRERLLNTVKAPLLVSRSHDDAQGKGLIAHHRNDLLGFFVYSAPGEDEPPVDLSAVLDNARKLVLTLESHDRDDFGSMTGALDDETIRKWKGAKRERSQGAVMQEEAPAVAHSLGLGVDFEWLHLAAHRFGGLNDRPQLASNLVLGTATANTFMMEWEEVISRLAGRDEVELVGLDVTPELVDAGLPWLAHSIEYTVTVYIDGEAFCMDQVFFPLDRRPPPLAGYITAKELAKQGPLPRPLE